MQRERDLGAAFDVSLRPVTLPSFAAIPCPRHEAGACERERRAEETGAHAHAHENACEPNPPRCPCKTHANEFASLLYCTVSLLSAGCSRSRRLVGRPSVWSCVLEPSTASSPPQNLVKTTRILDVRRNKATEARLSPSSAPTHQTAQNIPQPTHRCCDSSQQVRLQWVLAGMRQRIKRCLRTVCRARSMPAHRVGCSLHPA